MTFHVTANASSPPAKPPPPSRTPKAPPVPPNKPGGVSKGPLSVEVTPQKAAAGTLKFGITISKSGSGGETAVPAPAPHQVGRGCIGVPSSGGEGASSPMHADPLMPLSPELEHFQQLLASMAGRHRTHSQTRANQLCIYIY